jgi:probable selenium-dependent hydroxylase accessory protein YqeC
VDLPLVVETRKRNLKLTSLRYSLELKKGGVISIVGAGGKTALMFRLARELSKGGDRVLTTTSTKIFLPTPKQSSIVMISESAETIVQHARALFKRNFHITAGSAILGLKNKLKGLKPETIDTLWRSGVFGWIIVEADGAANRPLKAPAAHEPVIPQCTKWAIGIAGLESVGKPLTERWVFRPQLFSKITGLAPGEPINASAIADLFMSPDGVLKNIPFQAKRFAFLNQADSRERLENGKKIARIISSHKEAEFEGILIGQTLYDPPVKAHYPKG